MYTYILLLIALIIPGWCVAYNRVIRNNSLTIYNNAYERILFQERIYLVYAFILLLIIEGFRSSTVGEDTTVYCDWFESLYKDASFTDLPNLKQQQDVEYGFSALNIVIRYIWPNTRFFLFITSFIILILHFIYIKECSKNVVLSVLLFVCLNYFFTSMTTIRQYIAMGFVFVSLARLNQKKYIRFAVLSVLGVLFHTTALIFVFVVVFVRLFKFKKMFWLLVLIMATSILFLSDIVKIVIDLFPKYSLYFQDFSFGLSLAKIDTLKIVLDIFLICIFRREKNKDNLFLSNMLLFHIYFAILSFIIPHGFRMAYYFDYILVIALPKVLTKRGRDYSIQFNILIIVCVLFYLYYLFVNAAKIAPYSFF